MTHRGTEKGQVGSTRDVLLNELRLSSLMTKREGKGGHALEFWIIL